jgi:putative ABC transport system ATP-binding protein
MVILKKIRKWQVDKMENIIETGNLKKYYKRGSEVVKALDGVDFSINSREIVSVVGPSGSGKTTFMNIIGCLDTPTDGSIKIDGQDVTGFKESQLVKVRRKHIGFIFQRFHLIPTLTIKENIELPLIFAKEKPDNAKILALMERVGLKGKGNLRANMVSGGDKQKVSIMRALIYNPKILIADEPTGRLESKERNEIMKLFRELTESDYAIIIATHDMSIAEESDRIIHLQDGKVLQ